MRLNFSLMAPVEPRLCGHVGNITFSVRVCILNGR